MVSAPSFSKPYLRIQPPLQFPLKIRSSASGNFHLPILLLLVHKIIPTIPNNSPFLYTSAIFYLLIFAYNQPSQQSIAKISSLPQPLSQFSLHQGTRELGCRFGTDIILTSHFFLKVWTVTTGLTITGSLSLRIRILVYCR